MDGASSFFFFFFSSPSPHPFYLKKKKSTTWDFCCYGYAAFDRCLNSLAISLCLGSCGPASVPPSLPVRTSQEPPAALAARLPQGHDSRSSLLPMCWHFQGCRGQTTALGFSPQVCSVWKGGEVTTFAGTHASSLESASQGPFTSAYDFEIWPCILFCPSPWFMKQLEAYADVIAPFSQVTCVRCLCAALELKTVSHLHECTMLGSPGRQFCSDTPKNPLG